MFKIKKVDLKDEVKVKDGTYFQYGLTIFKVFIIGDIVKLAYYEESTGNLYQLDPDYTVDFVQHAVLIGKYGIIDPMMGEIMIPDKLKNYVVQIENKSQG